MSLQCKFSIDAYTQNDDLDLQQKADFLKKTWLNVETKTMKYLNGEEFCSGTGC